MAKTTKIVGSKGHELSVNEQTLEFVGKGDLKDYKIKPEKKEPSKKAS